MEFQGKKKYWKTPGESFDGISWEERKKEKKTIPRGYTVYENGYPQQKGRDYFWKSPYKYQIRNFDKNSVINKTVQISMTRVCSTIQRYHIHSRVKLD